MKLVLKVLAIGAVALVLLVVAAVLALDPLVHGAIERGTTYATGTRATLESVDVGLLSGTAEIAHLAIQNPDGFADEPFLALHSGRIEVDAAALLSSTIDVPLLELHGLTLNVERAGGKTNYGVLLDHMERLSGPSSGEEQASAGERRTLRVGRIDIRDVKAGLRLDLALTDASTTVEVDHVEVKDFESVGTQQENVARLTRELIVALLEELVASGGLPAELVGDLQERLGEVVEVIEEQGEAIREELEKAGEKIGEELEKGVEKAVDDLKSVLEDG